jgi:DNA polymerase-1
MKIYKNSFHTFEFSTVYVDTTHDAIVCLDRLDSTKLIGVDIETSKKPEWKEHEQAGLCPHLSDIRLIQLHDGSQYSYVFDVAKLGLEIFKSWLPKFRMVAHNGIFEISHLWHNKIPNLNIGCTMLLSQVIDGAENTPYEEDPDDDDEDRTGLSQYRRTGHGLDACIQRHFGVKVAKQQQTSDWGAPELSSEQIVYAGLDAVLTLKLAQVLAPKLKEHKMEKHYKLLKDMQHVISHMQAVGLPVDWEYHAKLIKEWQEKADESLAKCKPFFGETNMRSGKQMNAWLLEYLKDKPLELAEWPKTEKGSYTFTKTVIGAFTHLPAIKVLLQYKKYAKLIDTYGESLLKRKHPLTGRMHTSYTLGMTHTGRLSSRTPNVQNFPRDKEFRNMFKAPEGDVLVVSDFSQIETRLQSEFSKDPTMRDAYKTGKDLYKIMASSIYKIPVDKIDKTQRFVGKTCVLALGYGMGAKKMSMYALNAGIKEPMTFWEKAHKTYHTTFYVYSDWCKRMRDRAEKLGYIDTMMGKRRKLSEDELYTRAPNTVIQGSAAELMMTALLLCKERCFAFADIVATVHDEILLCVKKEDADKATELLAGAMNDAMLQMFPNAASHHVADASYAVAWGDAKAEL